MNERETPIRWAAGRDDLRGAFALRERVFCEEQGVPREAQLDAVALYEKAGFAVESETFEEAGIPHVWMGLSLSQVDSTGG